MKRVLVLGALGMAGHVMCRYLSQIDSYTTFGVARSRGDYVDYLLDVTEFEALKDIITDLAPDVVVNCVGVLVSESENRVCDAVLLNSYLPNYLAMLGDAQGFKVIHISTDCVFSGRVGSYTENFI